MSLVVDPQDVTDPPSIFDLLSAAAAYPSILRGGKTQAHRDAHYLVTVVPEEQRGDGRIHPAAYGDEGPFLHRSL